VAEESNSEATPRNLLAGSRHEKTRRPCGVRAKSNSRELEEQFQFMAAVTTATANVVRVDRIACQAAINQFASRSS
jgi:hypothetical protein